MAETSFQMASQSEMREELGEKCSKFGQLCLFEKIVWLVECLRDEFQAEFTLKTTSTRPEITNSPYHALQ